MKTFIHSFICSNHLILVRVVVDLEPFMGALSASYPGCMGMSYRAQIHKLIHT